MISGHEIASVFEASEPGLLWATAVWVRCMLLLGVAWLLSLALRRAPAAVRHVL